MGDWQVERERRGMRWEEGVGEKEGGEETLKYYTVTLSPPTTYLLLLLFGRFLLGVLKLFPASLEAVLVSSLSRATSPLPTSIPLVASTTEQGSPLNVVKAIGGK